jgi:hypothetical protein
MKIGRILSIGAGFIFVILALFSIVMAIIRDGLFDIGMEHLDSWVANGANLKTLQSQVVEPCGNIIITQAGWFERLELMTIYRSEFDIRVAVCTKMTVNRRYPQPEFKNAKLEYLICDDPNPYHEVLRHLCQRSGLLP